MRSVTVIISVLLIAIVTGSRAIAHPANCPSVDALPSAPSAAGISATGSAFLDYFTGGGSYMPRTHCLRTPQGEIDWPWIGGLLILSLGVIIAYLRIFGFWMKSYFAEERRDRNPKLLDLSGIFLWCAICGYAFSMLMFFWPAYRLLAFALVVLNIFSWKFVSNLEPFRVAFAANRLQRQLNESLRARADELERLVAERTREAEQARAVADTANRAKSEFLANMSHEIRTPLTAILGFTDILVDADLNDPSAAEAAQTISRNGHHLVAVINDILDLSKIEAGQMTIDRKRTRLMGPIEEVMTLMRAKASAKGLLLLCEPIEPLPATLISDATRFRQILSNLIGNAIKFTEQGTVRVRISHESAETRGSESGALRVEVIDSGIGIADDHIERLFQPFTQADDTTTRRFGGTGLGLSISRKLARMLGGDIACTSRPGHGSTFTLTIETGIACNGTLPADQPRGECVPHEQSTEARPSESALAGRRILMADDGPDNRKLLSMFLIRSGARLEVVENGAQALDLAIRTAELGDPFDLILMDMQMPDVDGYAATRMLRDRGYEGLIVALTANAMSTERERCLRVGCDEFLTKPITRSTLVNACARIIESRTTAAM